MARAVSATVALGFLELDSAFRVVYASPDASLLLERPAEKGIPLSELVSGTSAASVWEGNTHPETFETTWLTLSGKAIAVSLVRVGKSVLAYLADSPRGHQAAVVPRPDTLPRILNMNAGKCAAFTLDGKVYASNLRWSEFFGMAAPDVQLQQLVGQALGGEVVDTRDLVRICREHLERSTKENWMVNAAGERRYILWTATVDETRNLIFVVGTDLTDQKRKEIAEAESREEFESRYSAASVGVCHINLSGRYIRVNQKFQDLLGYTAEELTSMTFIDITHPDDLDEGMVQTELLLAGDLDRFSMEKRYIRKDGKIVHTHLTVTLIRDEHFAPKMMMSAVGEIQDKAGTDSALRKSEQYYRAWFDPTDRTYWTAAPGGAILELSNNGGLTIGVTPDKLIHDGWQNYVHPEDLPRVLNCWNEGLESGQRFFCEYRVRVFDGGYHWVRSQALPHRENGREILCWYGYTDDIHFQRLTEEHLAQMVEDRTRELTLANEALIEARDAALAASLAKSQFLANISHEIRTPMNGVIGIASLLKEQPLDPKSARFVDLICQSGEALVQIIDDILDFSKIEAGRVTIEPSPHNVMELISDVVALFQGHAKSKNLKLQIETDLQTVPSVLVDAFRLRQVLSNLIGNAIKFTHAGWVVIQVGGQGTDDGFEMTISVKDSGIGIRSEDISAIFESFTQADGSIQRRYGGTGLGLTISKNLLELMGGTLSVESQVGVGTTMVIHLPLKLDASISRLKG